MTNASLVILDAQVVTLDKQNPKAQAIAILDDRIVAVGSNREIQSFIDPHTKIIHAKWKTVIPGLVDCHVHMASLGFSLQELDLREVRSVEEMQKKLGRYAREQSEVTWILGGRWDHEKFKEKRLPNRWDLDEVVEDRPVLLDRVCGHIAVANTKALQLAGITERTKTRGGLVDLDRKTGKPTGILRENCLEAAREVIPSPSIKQCENACISAAKEAVSAGLTEVHWLISSSTEMQALRALQKKKALPIRVYLGISPELFEHITASGGAHMYKDDDWLKIGFVKLLVDGSLGAHTAALTVPYSDKPNERGIMVCSQKNLDRLVLRIHKAGFQIGAHAIGDRAIGAVINSYEKALKNAPRTNHRHRIEHCSVISTELIEGMKKAAIIASVQPHFAVSDFWALDRLGKNRMDWFLPFRKLVDSGVVVVSGSDCPVERISPILGLWAATTRNDGQHNLTAEEALKTYTLNAAYASFDEDRKGILKAECLADMTVLSKNPLDIPAQDIRKIQVEMVIIGGNTVFERHA